MYKQLLHMRPHVVSLSTFTSQVSELQVTENSAQLTQAEMELTGSPMYLRITGTSDFRHGWIQVLRCCHQDLALSISQLSFPLHLLFSQMSTFFFITKQFPPVALNFLKIPSLGEKEEPLFPKSVNSSLGLISLGPNWPRVCAALPSQARIACHP